MTFKVKHLFMLFVAALSIPWTVVYPQDVIGEADEFLRNRIESAGMPPQLTVGEEFVYASIVLPRFYERRGYWPAWSDEKGPTPQAGELVQALHQAYQEGLRPADYHLDKIIAILTEISENQKKKLRLNPRRLVDLDLLLTDAFLIYGSHLLAGRVNPETIDSEWFANRREVDLAETLQKGLGNKNLSEMFMSLLPPQPGYARLREALVRYREVQTKGGWATVSEGPKLQEGVQDARVVELRRRLAATGDLVNVADTSTVFDAELTKAVRKFQTRHGLDVDGTVGPATLAALNVSVSERVSQIEVNLERWRWLPQDLGRRYILVNIANFELEVVEAGEVVLEMRVIVGRDYRRTPVFSDRMTYLVFGPYWHVPQNLAVQDILPSIRKDPEYLAKQKFQVFIGWGAEAVAVDPSTVDWSQVTARNFSYRFRQDPGPNNALGSVKFMFPNQFNVYLHDTPTRGLFAKTVRAFSSGCIRIEKPLELAEYVLRGDPRWTRTNIEATIKRWQEQTVRLPEPIPVHLLYWTAWANPDGSINFRNDIYGRDKPLYDALHEEPPGD